MMGKNILPDNKNFEEFTYFPNDVSVEDVKIPEAESKILTYGNLSINIDSNWTQDSNGNMLLPIQTKHDAYMALSNLTSDGQLEHPTLHIAYLKLINNQGFISGDSINIQMYDDRTVLSYKIYDYRTQRYTVFYEFLFQVDNRIYIVTFSAFDTFFRKNFEYFQDLFTNMKVE